MKSLPHTSGIYRVLDATGTVIYVGQAGNLYHRWNNGHHKISEIISEYGIHVYVDWVEVPQWLLNRAESAAVSFYKPKLNSRTPPIV